MRRGNKVRLDQLMVDRGLAESRSIAQRLIIAGEVRINGEVALKPGREVDASADLSVERPPKYVSRGGEKLEAALAAFGVSPRDWTCADVGASTGGFTDCLLQHGARRVYAIDVGHGILHWSLRQDPRVVVMERTNARHLEALPESVRLVTVDASFISLKLLLPPTLGWVGPDADWIALVKPQFEAGRKSVGKGGVVRDPAVHRRVVEGLIQTVADLGLRPKGLIRSPLLGPKGNTEFLLWAAAAGPAADPQALLTSLFGAAT